MPDARVAKSVLERDVVVGRGAVAARRARRGGLEVAVVDRDVRARGEPATLGAAAHAAGVVPTAEELHGVRDDLHALALVAVLGLPLAPLEAAVERDGAPLGEEARAVLALGAPDRDVEEVRLVLPLAGRLVLAPRVGGDAQGADRHAALGGAQLGISGQVAREDNAVDVRRGHDGSFRLRRALEARWLAESTAGSGRIRGVPADWGSFVAKPPRSRARAWLTARGAGRGAESDLGGGLGHGGRGGRRRGRAEVRRRRSARAELDDPVAQDA